MTENLTIAWLKEPEAKDYPAALSYLSLLYDEAVAQRHVTALRRAAPSEFKAGDVLRASGLPLLAASNPHVEKDLQKIRAAQALSPLLLLRDSPNGRVIVADGYHRLCAVCLHDEDAAIPCRIA